MNAIKYISLPVIFLAIVAWGCNPGYNSSHYEMEPADELVPFVVYTLEDEEFTNEDLKKDRKTLFYYSDPRCNYCHDQTLWLMDNMNNMQDIQIVIVSPRNRNQTAEFYQRYDFNDFENITVVYDRHDIFMNSYFIDLYPYMLIFDEGGKLVTTFSGLTEMYLVNEAVAEK